MLSNIYTNSEGTLISFTLIAVYNISQSVREADTYRDFKKLCVFNDLKYYTVATVLQINVPWF